MRLGEAGLLAAVGLICALSSSAQQPGSDAWVIARARRLELPTPYLPPPGDPLEHYTSGFAKTLCSAVFITGLDPEFAAANVGFFTSPPAERAKVAKPVIDRDRQEVRIALPSGVTRIARKVAGQGCVTLPTGGEQLFFTPKPITTRLPEAASQDWPMGDRLPEAPPPAGVDQVRLAQAVAAAFAPAEAMTAAFVVTWKGRLIAEHYGDGITAQTPLESWSMGKSLTATLLGRLMLDGAYRLEQRAPIPEWQQDKADPRRQIRVRDLLNMSSGLRIRAPYDPEFDAAGPYPDHWYLYTGGVDSFHYAATRPLEWPPGTVGRYRNTDPVLVNYLIRLAVEGRGEDYLSFPQRALFDKLGIRTMVMETDPYGNFLGQGYELASARDWARLGNLYLQDGVWNGERLLPKDYVTFVRSLAPAWRADHRPIYGGFFWLNGDGGFPIPKSAYFMAGAGEQYTIIIPSHDLVVVRIGHYGGAEQAPASLKQALTLLLQAVPRHT